MRHDQILADFANNTPALDALRERVEGELRGLIADANLPVQIVSSRTKSIDSLRRKLALPEKTYQRLTDVTDLVGVRIAATFEDTIEDVARLIERTYQVDFGHSTDKLRTTDHERFGYRSLHYVCGVPDDSGLPPQMRFEVQVRTVLQHAWAEVEHDLGYKATEEVPAVIRRRFSRIASLLEIADQEFVSIRSDLSRYQQRVRDELHDANRPLPLDLVSLSALVRTESFVVIDASVARALGKPVVDEPWSPSYLVDLLKLAGITTTSDAVSAAQRHSTEVARVIEPYFRFAKDTFGLDADNVAAVQRGYGLFFVAHIAMLHGNDLGINKVARVARVYNQLDYPDDLKEAQRIASGLVDVFSAALDR
jgi:ppGpp synthetase/RelA/SpoT-type nucleotidyltranferase